MAVQTVELHDATVARIREVQRSVKGKIRVRAPRHEFSDPLLGYIMEFQKEYPNIEVVVLPWIEESAIRDITAGKVECAYAGQGFRPEGGETPVRGVCQVPFARAEVSLCLHESNALAKKDRVSLGDLDGCKISIPANQKNDTWVATVQSFADENGIAISFNEKYCDSLEDFVVNRLGSEDLFIARRGLLKLQAFKYRPDIVILPFDPMLYMRCEMAYADNDDPALRLFVGFLRDKYHRETEAARLEGGGPDER